MTLGEAIEELIRQYDKACGMIGMNPVTVALRETFFIALDEDNAEEAKKDVN